MKRKRGRGRPRTVSGPRRGFAARFHRARTALGLSQQAAADALGVAVSSIKRWETNLCEPEGLARRYVDAWIARATGEGGIDGA